MKNDYSKRSMPLNWGVSKSLTTSFALILLYATNFGLPGGPGDGAQLTGYLQNRTVRYSFTVRNKTNRLIKGAEFWTYAPVKQTSFQKTGTIEASHDFTLSEDEIGNQRLIFKLDLAPFATKVVAITARLDLSEKSNPIVLDTSADYTGHQKYIEIDNPKIIALSRQFAGNEVNTELESAFDWVAENIEYAGYIEDDRGALYALENKRGDCTEYMYLFAALARTKNIPTRAIGGYVVSEDAVLKAKDFHNWAEVYIEGSWRVVDPQNRKFLQEESNYIAMRVISGPANKTNDLLSNTHRFSHVGEGLHVRMN